MGDYGFEIRRRDMVIGYMKRALTCVADVRTYPFDDAADFAKATMVNVDKFTAMSEKEFRKEFHLPEADQPDMYRDALNRAEAG